MANRHMAERHMAKRRFPISHIPNKYLDPRARICSPDGKEARICSKVNGDKVSEARIP